MIDVQAFPVRGYYMLRLENEHSHLIQACSHLKALFGYLERRCFIDIEDVLILDRQQRMLEKDGLLRLAFLRAVWTWPHQCGHIWEAEVPHLPSGTFVFKGLTRYPL